jgi:hypothetical protein
VTSAPTTQSSPPRFLVKPDGAVTGFVDGGWWPRSRDLAAELPDLVAAVADRIGSIERVSYNLAGWDAADRKVDVGGVVVRLAGFRAQPAHTVDVIGARRQLTLLVVPPDTAPETATRALARASLRAGSDRIAELLGGHDDR